MSCHKIVYTFDSLMLLLKFYVKETIQMKSLNEFNFYWSVIYNSQKQLVFSWRAGK